MKILSFGARHRVRNDLFPDLYLGHQEAHDFSGWRQTTADAYLVRASTKSPRWIESCDDAVHPGPPYRSGGPLYIRRLWDGRSVLHFGIHPQCPQKLGSSRYVGGFGPAYVPWGLTGMPTYSTATAWSRGDGITGFDGYGDPSSYGATGWSKFKPGRSSAELGVFLGELKDVPHMLKQTSKGFADLWRSMGGHPTLLKPKKVADHFLNHQFGWLPFINDLRKFYKTYKTLDSRLQRIKDYNGRWETRGGVVTTSRSKQTQRSSATITGHNPSLTSYYYPVGISTSGSHELSVTNEERVWFEASFRYYIQDIGSVSWRRRAIAEMFGLYPHPSIVWELTPWSWLVDWCSNAGDVISNMGDNWADNLVARWAYVMGTYRMNGRLQSTLNLYGSPLHDEWNWSVETKTRLPASPFGFGLKLGDLSLRQLAILTALGISKNF